MSFILHCRVWRRISRMLALEDSNHFCCYHPTSVTCSVASNIIRHHCFTNQTACSLRVVGPRSQSQTQVARVFRVWDCCRVVKSRGSRCGEPPCGRDGDSSPTSTRGGETFHHVSLGTCKHKRITCTSIGTNVLAKGTSPVFARMAAVVVAGRKRSQQEVVGLL